MIQEWMGTGEQQGEGHPFTYRHLDQGSPPGQGEAGKDQGPPPGQGEAGKDQGPPPGQGEAGKDQGPPQGKWRRPLYW
jgi:hypothetical protein